MYFQKTEEGTTICVIRNVSSTVESNVRLKNSVTEFLQCLPLKHLEIKLKIN